MLGLSPLELGRLRMSVGYGGHKTGRPLSPIEVAKFFRQAKDAGMSLAEIAAAVNLKGTSQPARFLQILQLPAELHHLIGWGRGKDTIGFFAAFELSRIDGVDNQLAVAKSMLANRLTKEEVRQVAQLRVRAARPVDECLREVLGMRPKITKRYVFIGSVTDHAIADKLRENSQSQRDAMMQQIIAKLNLVGASGRLGPDIFTLVGGDRFNASMSAIGKNQLEARICNQLEAVV